MEKGLSKIFWGLIFILFDLRIVIDVLPDFIGYLIIIYGLKELSEFAEIFKKAIPFAFALILFSLPDIILKQNEFTSFQPTNLSIAFMLMMTIVIIIRLFMVYYIFQGIYELLTPFSDEKMMANKAITRWKAYLISNSIYIAVLPFGMNISPDIFTYLILSTGILAFIIEIVFILTIHQVKRSLIPIYHK